jgi:hypothetical protein
MLEDNALSKTVIPTATAERWRRAAALVEEADRATFEPHLDVEALLPRTSWIVRHLLGIRIGGDLAEAATMAAWEQERASAREWPHLRAYWLLHHLIFDNREELAELCEPPLPTYPAVAELELAARELLAGAELSAAFWDDTKVRGLRTRALDEQRQGLFGAAALARLEQSLAGRRAAEARMAQARAMLAHDADEKSRRALELWDLLASGAGRVTAFEEGGAKHLIKDPDQQMEILLQLRRGQSSLLPHLFDQLADQLAAQPPGQLPAGLDERWRDFFGAAMDRGAEFSEEHAAAIPGALFGLGLALGDFAELQRRVEAAPFYPDNFGRRRRLELTCLAKHQWDQGEAPRAFLRQEAARYAAQFSGWQADTYPTALRLLLEKQDPAAMELFNAMFAGASFSGANWRLALGLAELCRKHRVAGASAGLWAAVNKHLGRHDDGDRGEVIRAYAACAPDPAEATQRLQQLLADHSDSRKACQDASILAGLVDLSPQTFAEPARQALRALLEKKGSGAMEFGAGVSLLRAARDAKLGGFGELARALRESADKYAKKELLAWLTAQLEDWTS